MIDKLIRYTMGIILGLMYTSHYLIMWINEGGVGINNLPFQFLSLIVMVCFILVFTKSKKIHALALYVGILGGMLNMVTNQVGYSFLYFRYYQFMISNALIIIIPMYFLIAYEYFPSLKQLLKVLAIIQGVIILIFLFNLSFDTNYMYLKIGESIAHKGTIISYLGKWPWYIIWLELIGIASIMIIHFSLQFLINQKNRVSNVNITTQSAYMTKKKQK